jgi:hypothetical protein
LGAVALAAGMAPWLIVLLVRVGGLAGFMTMMRVYSAEQAASHMLAGAFWWASLGVVPWIPAVLLLCWRKARWRKVSPDQKRGIDKGQAYFLVAWFLPLFLFSVVVHIAASGHALGFLPILCLVGGWVLAEVGATCGRFLMIACAIIALGLNVVFFFNPYSREVAEASYQTVSGVSEVNETALRKIDGIVQQNPAFLVSDNAWVSWRILQYYYPKTPLIYIPAPMAAPGTSLPVWLIQNRLRVRDLDANTELQLSSCGKIVWFVTDDRARQQLLAVKDAEAERYFIVTPARPGMHFTVGRYRLGTSSKPCPTAP